MKATIPMEEANPAADRGTVANCYNETLIDSDSLALKLIGPCYRSRHIVRHSTLDHVSLLACSVHVYRPHEALHIYWVLVLLTGIAVTSALIHPTYHTWKGPLVKCLSVGICDSDYLIKRLSRRSADYTL